MSGCIIVCLKRGHIYFTRINYVHLLFYFQFHAAFFLQVSERQFEKFLKEFPDPVTGQPLYLTMLEEVVASEADNLNLSCDKLFTYDERLYYELVSYPQELIPLCDMVVNRVVDELFPDRDPDAARIQVPCLWLCFVCKPNEVLSNI